MSVINTNVTSLIAQQNLSRSQNNLSTAMERLSSGMRINSAKDDAAGQAIANRMTSQVSGLNQAQRNANDGISVAQTAEGGLNQINDNLQRIRVLSVQAENSTNSQEDLNSIQNEIGQRLEEINRISRETDFNGTKVLGANEGGNDPTSRSMAIQVGSEDGQVINIQLQQINADTLNLLGFNINGSGTIDNAAATADNLVLLGFEEVGQVGNSTQYNRDSIATNSQAGAGDIVSLMSDGDTVNVSGLNNGLAPADGDTYTYDADSDSFTFNASAVGSGDVASFLMPAAGESLTARVDLGGGAQTIVVNADGNVSNTDGDRLYITNDGLLTTQGSDELTAATLDNLTARLAAAPTAMPDVNVTQGTNQVETVTLTALTNGQSTTLNGLTATATGAVTDVALAAAFEEYIETGAYTGAALIEFSGTFNADAFELTTGTGGTATLEFTTTQTGSAPESISAFELNAATATAGAVSLGTSAANATATETTVTFQALATGASVTVGGVELTATDTMTNVQVAQAFADYFDNGSGIANGTFSPVGPEGTEVGNWSAATTGADVTFTRDDPGALAGLEVTGTVGTVSTVDGTNARTAEYAVEFVALSAGESFNLTNGSSGADLVDLTFTASGEMTASEVAAAFESALQSQDALSADDRFSGDWNFTGDQGWSVDSRSGEVVTFQNTSTSDSPSGANIGDALTAFTRLDNGGATVGGTVAATAEVTEITFGALESGQALTIDGLTLTANEAMTAEEVARAYSDQIGTSNGYTGEQAAFTGELGSQYEAPDVSNIANGELTLTNSVDGAITADVTTVDAIIGGSLTVGDTVFTANEDGTYDVTAASITAQTLVTEGAGLSYSMELDDGEGGSITFDIADTGNVTQDGNLQYLSTATGELTTDDEETTTENLFAHENGNVTDAAGNRIYLDQEGEVTTDAVTTGGRTENALGTLDGAIQQVDALRSDLGAIQNRLESAIDNLNTTETNLSSARSRIQDADYAVEVANMTRAQILQQAGTSVLAQANQIPQNVLSLLG